MDRTTLVPLLTGTAFLAAFFLLVGLWQLGASRRSRAVLTAHFPQGPASEEERPGLFRALGERYDRSPQGQQIRLRLIHADLPRLKPSEFQAIVILLGMVTFYLGILLLGLPPFLALILGVAVAMIGPRMYLNSRKDRYIQRFNAQLVDVTVLISNTLRAGLSLPQAIATVAREIPNPAGAEFALVVQELRLGTDMGLVMERMMQRLPSEELRVLITAILVQRRAGGNLAKVLQTLSETIAERHRQEEEIRTSTAEVRFSSILVAILPIAMVLMLKLAMPAFIDPLFVNPLGWVILGLFAGVQLGAFLLVRRVSTIRV